MIMQLYTMTIKSLLKFEIHTTVTVLLFQ